jgi:ABC-2 type transport system permease protein
MKGKFQADAYIKFLIYLAVIVLINIAGLTLFFRIDLTGSKIYSLSEASRAAVSNLSEPLTINVFFTENLPAPHNSTQRYLMDLLEEYAIYANKKFNYRFYDVSPQEEGVTDKAIENRKLAENYGIFPVEIRVLEKDEVKFKKAYMGLVMIHGDLIEQIPAITTTDGLEYKLTTNIQKLNNKISKLESLKEKINIRLIMSSSLNQVAPYMGLDDLAQLPDKIKEIVAKLNEKNYGQLTYQYLDPPADTNLEEVSDKYNVMTLKWPDISQNNISAGEGVIGISMEFAQKKSSIPLLNVMRIPIFGTRYELTKPEALEEMINENIETLIGINEDIGYLADHGTLEIPSPMMGMQQQEGIRNFQALLSENYAIKQVSLSNEDIPKSLNCLIIAQPTEAFSDYELYQIDQALMRGTNLAIFTDAFKEIPQPPQQQFSFNMGPSYQPLATGLEKLLKHYGVEVKQSYVLDKNCFKQTVPTRSGGGGERPIYFAPMIQNDNINHDFDYLKNIKGLITINNSPLALDQETLKAGKLTAHQLFASSKESWEMTGKINLNPMFIQPPEKADTLKSFPLGYLVEGQFPSYFTGKEIPQKEVKDPKKSDEKSDITETDVPEAEAEKSKKPDVDLSKIESKSDFVQAGKPAKICIIGSSALLKDNMIDADGAGPNAAFVLNLIDMLNHRENIAVMRSKTQAYNPLKDTDVVVKNAIKLFNIAGLPVLIVVFGLLTLWMRKLRRRRIQTMFQ